LKDGVRASLRTLELGPAEIGFPLLAATYRAALAAADFIVFVTGPTGVFKTAIASVSQQHFGPGLDASHLPVSFASTLNAIEALAFSTGDSSASGVRYSGLRRGIEEPIRGLPAGPPGACPAVPAGPEGMERLP
jgi:hypothetical protein